MRGTERQIKWAQEIIGFALSEIDNIDIDQAIEKLESEIARKEARKVGHQNPEGIQGLIDKKMNQIENLKNISTNLKSLDDASKIIDEKGVIEIAGSFRHQLPGTAGRAVNYADEIARIAGE